MNYKIITLLVLMPFLGFSQENNKIDSLNKEIIMHRKKIEELKTKIKDEILVNGYFIKVKSNYSFSRITMKKTPYGKVIDIIPDDSVIKVLDKKSGYYKIDYNDKIGFVNSYTLKIDGFPYLSLLDYNFRSKKNKSNSYRTYNHKTLDYSKPIKVKGHYRTTKSGKRVWVRAHTRNN